MDVAARRGIDLLAAKNSTPARIPNEVFSFAAAMHIPQRMEPISRFFTDRSVTFAGTPRQLRVENLGPFRLPTGIIAAGDGFYPEPHRTAEELPTTEGVLELAVATDASGDERILVARVRYSDAPVDDWYHLPFRGAKAIELEPDSLGILWGESDVLPLKTVDPRVPTKTLEKNYRPTCAWAVGDVNGASYAIVSSGLETGPVYFYRGIDADGETVALLLDFTGTLREGWD